MKYDVSIIVPVFNCEKYIRKCIHSLINQTLKNIEVIIIDDGSTDMSGVICDEYNIYPQITVIHKENYGLGAARNTGIKVAQGDYIGFVDGDDWVPQDAYEYLYKLSKLNNADIVAGEFFLTNGTEKIEEKEIDINVFENQYKLEFYLECGIKYRNSQYSVCNKIYKRKLFNNICFPENCYYEDVVTNFKLIDLANKFVVSNKIVYFYFQNSTSITRNKFSKKDLYLLNTGEQIIDLSLQKKHTKVYNLAKIYSAKINLSLLIKYMYYGYDASIEQPKKTFNCLQKDLKKNTFLLLKSPILLSRKLALLIIVICPIIAQLVFGFLRKVRWLNE